MNRQALTSSAPSLYVDPSSHSIPNLAGTTNTNAMFKTVLLGNYIQRRSAGTSRYKPNEDDIAHIR